MKTRAYLSVSKKTDWDIVEEVFSLFPHTYEVKYYERGTPYTDSDLVDSEVCFIIPNMELDPGNSAFHVSKGQYREIYQSLSMRKPVYAIPYSDALSDLRKISSIDVYNKNDWKHSYGTAFLEPGYFEFNEIVLARYTYTRNNLILLV